MEGFSKIGEENEFYERSLKNVFVHGINVVVVKVDGLLHAFENNCPHQHFSVLHEGVLEGCSLTCPMHGWTFDVKSGKSTNGNGTLRIFVVKHKEGSVWIESARNESTYALFD